MSIMVVSVQFVIDRIGLISVCQAALFIDANALNLSVPYFCIFRVAWCQVKMMIRNHLSLCWIICWLNNIWLGVCSSVNLTGMALIDI